MPDEIKMKQWSVIYAPGFDYMLAGTAGDHPKLGINARIPHTDPVKSFEIVNDVARVETQSDTYLCPLKYLDLWTCLDEPMGGEDNVVGDMKEIFNYVRYKLRPSSMEDPDPDRPAFRHIDELRKAGVRELAAERAENVRRMMDFAAKYDHSLYIELSSVSVGSPGVANMDGKLSLLEPELRTGPVADAVCYTRAGVLDFRYWPYRGPQRDSQVYIWSESLKHVFIRNLKADDVTFNGQRLRSGIVTELTRPAQPPEPWNNRV